MLTFDRGFKICRAIALRHPQSCIAIHTVGPEVPAPRFGSFTFSWLKYHLARLTYTLTGRPGFGYTPEDLSLTGLSLHQQEARGATPPVTPTVLQLQSERPQTISYALTDSPAGLLAYLFDLIRTPSPTTARQVQRNSQGFDLASLQNPWTPSAIITWTMMYWLPGPEVALRWLANSATTASALWNSYSNVPLGISLFHESETQRSAARGGGSPVGWVEAYHRIAVVRRREGRVKFAAWERPSELVVDIRELADTVIRERVFGTVQATDLSVD